MCLWVNGEAMSEELKGGSSTVLGLDQSVLITSCIFYNFSNVCRAGINSSIVIQKSLIKDSLAVAIHSVNPKALMIDRCSI